MSTINIDLAADTILNVMIGQQDENEVREVVFDFSGWYTTYGSGTISLAIQRPKDEWPYEGTLTVDSTNHKATWEISETDTAYAGTGQIQLSYKVGDAKKKSVVYRFTCHKSLGALGSVVTPVQIQTFIDEVEEALQTMDGKLDDMEDEITDVKQDLYNVSSDITELQNGVSYTDVKTELTITTDTKSLKEDGTMVAFGGYSLKADVEGYEIVEFVAKNFMTNSSNPYPVTAFTDQNGNIVKMTTAGAYVNNHTYTEKVPQSAKYFYINTWSTNGTISGIIRTYSIPNTINDSLVPIKNNIVSNGLYDFLWTNRIYFWNVGTRSTDATRIGLANVLQAKTDLKIVAESGYNITIMIFSSSTESLNTQVRFSNWVTDGIVYKDEYFLINVRKTDNSVITPTESYNAVCMQYSVTNGTVLQPSGIKTEVLTKQIGVLTKFQSFCIYDNKYYSTDGDNISVQDSDFTAISTTALSVGHGNSFQLGSSNKGYISGWEDQKVYVIDMDNITVDSVITLPTTGYTTVAIDDLNKIAYIFQRSTNPNSVTNYNFITYDYENQQVISTKILSNPFGAMQATDFYNGKIFVAYGLGTSAVPSGLVVYNTNGDVLAEYDLNIFDSLEPEGVCFNRTDKTLLISDVNKKVYTVI